MQSTIVKGYRLSHQQSRCWQVQDTESVSQARVEVWLEGELEEAQLKRAFERVMQEQTILRTVYRRVEGMDLPVQVVRPASAIDDCLDWSYEEEEEGRERLDERGWTTAELEAGPVVRARVVWVGQQQRWRLEIALPVLAADAETMSLLVEALSQAYAREQGMEADEEEEEKPLEYVDVAAWQDELLEEEEAYEGRSYWERLWGAEARRMEVPLGRRPSPGVAGKPAGVPWARHETAIAWTAEQSRSLLELSERLGVTAEAVVLASWQVVLWRVSEQEEVVLGVARNGRAYEELERACGLYTRFVPLRETPVAEETFAQLALQAEQALKEATRWQTYFAWDRGSQAGEAMPFPLSFVWEAWPQAWQRGGLSWQMLHWEARQEPTVLQLHGREHHGHIQLCLWSALEWMSARASGRVASSLQSVLWAGVQAPQTPLEALPLLTAEQEEELVRLGQEAEREREALAVGSIAEAFAQQVARTPDLPAVVGGGQQLSYAQLDAQATQLAQALRARGLRSGQLVGLWSGRSVAAVVGLLGILKAGGGYVPLDPEQPAERVQRCLTDLDSGLLLSERAMQQRVPAWNGRVLVLEDLLEAHEEDAREAVPLVEDWLEAPAYVIYTSGSTGVPKGVCVSQGNLLHYIRSLQTHLQGEAGWHYGLFTTLAADLGKTMLYGALLSGGCLHVLSYEQVTDVQRLHAAVEAQPLDVAKLVPSHLHALLAASAQPAALLPRRALLLGGEAFGLGLLEQLRALGRTCQVYNHYGPTETTVGACLHELGVLDAESTLPGEPQWTSVPIGRPLEHMRAVVVDARGLLVPWGMAGELWLAGTGVSQGYVGRPELTAQSYGPQEQGGAGERWYHTGDRVRWTEEGQLSYEGRRDGQVKVRGVRVELGEIEAVLREQEGVREAVVVLREERLVAYVVGSQADGPQEQTLRGALAHRLPEAMQPATYVVLSDWPRTRNGKIDRQALPEPAEVQEAAAPAGGAEMQEWRSPVEELVAKIWQEVLGIRHRPLGRQEHFFHLGGHSLLATQVMARLRTEFDVEVPILALFEAPTVAGLSQRVEQALREQEGVAAVPALVPISRTQPLPLSFAQQRLWFLHQLEPESSFYNKLVAVWLTGLLDVCALEQSLNEIVHRHEILRTTFAMRGDQPIQVIASVQRILLPVIDLRGLLSDGSEHQMRRILQQAGRKSFHLSQGPLLRAYLLRIEEQKYAFLLVMHHIVSDGWSNSILTRELTTLYQAFEGRRPSPLPALAIQYADYAVWQRNWLQGEVLEHHLAYWRRQLAGIQPLALPTDHPRPPVQRYRGDSYNFALSPELTDALRRLSQQKGVTLFMLLLAAFQTFLYRWSGQDDIVVGTDVANRSQEETERLIGFFVNLLALRTSFKGKPTFCKVLERVREMVLGAYTYQDTPFELLVDVLQPQHSLDRMPLVQVIFVMQNVPQASVELSNVSVQTISGEVEVAKFDLAVFVREGADKLYGSFNYCTDLFDSMTIQRSVKHFETLLHNIVTQPDAAVNALEIYTEEEKKALAARKKARKMLNRQELLLAKDEKIDLM